MIVRSPCSEHPISLKLDSLGMRYNKKIKTKKNLEKTFFFAKKNPITFWKKSTKSLFQKTHIFSKINKISEISEILEIFKIFQIFSDF